MSFLIVGSKETNHLQDYFDNAFPHPHPPPPWIQLKQDVIKIYSASKRLRIKNKWTLKMESSLPVLTVTSFMPWGVCMCVTDV